MAASERDPGCTLLKVGTLRCEKHHRNTFSTALPVSYRSGGQSLRAKVRVRGSFWSHTGLFSVACGRDLFRLGALVDQGHMHRRSTAPTWAPSFWSPPNPALQSSPQSRRGSRHTAGSAPPEGLSLQTRRPKSSDGGS